ncbi:MAG TPA: hypothetical protein VHV49_16575 [Pseudonocardiaceae bacterium]|nr:hypothetical protein [Pseudonocardiaceae bacterium]
MPPRPAPDDVKHLSEAARHVAGHLDDLASWLDELRNDEAAVRTVAERSYWHPNGFAKLVLHTEPDHRLRLHVWPAGDGRLGESNPHSHRWPFASTVVTGGGLHMVEYTESATRGRRYDRYRYGADPADRAALLADGDARLTRVRSLHNRPGGVYSCDTDVVHTVAPIGAALTATVVVQGPQRTPSTVVYRWPGLGDDQPNGVLTEADVLSLTGAVLAGYRGSTQW